MIVGLFERDVKKQELGLCFFCVRLGSCKDVIQAVDREQTITKCWDFKSRFGGM